MRMTVTAKPGNLQESIAARRREATQRTVQILGQVGELGVRGATVLAPKGPTRNYVEGLDSTVRTTAGDMAVTIGARAPHSHIVERGRQPGRMPPTAKIAVIFAVPRSQAFLIARAIGRAGTRGAHVLERTADAIRPQVHELAAKLAREIGRLQ